MEKAESTENLPPVDASRSGAADTVYGSLFRMLDPLEKPGDGLRRGISGSSFFNGRNDGLRWIFCQAQRFDTGGLTDFQSNRRCSGALRASVRFCQIHYI